jgi:phage terminase large subunit-like protein
VGAAELATHLTGEYPETWFGRRWERPVRAWAAGESGQVVRDVSQKLLCGDPKITDSLGTGMIPRDAFVGKPTMSRGVADAFDSVEIKHLAPDQASYDGVSTLQFKSYEQGYKKMQGDTIDIGWCDEEPDEAVYAEILTRISATDGMVYLTFTPLKGMSQVVRKFLSEQSADRIFVNMTIEDAEHIAPDKRAAIIAGYPEHMREAKARGVPMQGEGVVFPYSQTSISEPAIPFEFVPQHWAKLWAIDFGIAHNFAAVLLAWDKDADVVHVLHTIRMGGAEGSVITPLQHSAAIKAVGSNIPVAWPHDGGNREKSSGETLITAYKKEPNNLLVLPTHAQWPDGGYSFEAGIMEMQTRMEAGKLKVASHLMDWFEECRNYHREKGLVIKVHDDIMSATRIGIMAKRYGKTGPILGGARPKRRPGEVEIAKDVDFSLF